jgi:tetratricopeptide (TPR) repeat protein
MNKYDTSIYYFDKVIELKEAYYYKGIAYYNKEIYSEAFKNFHTYISLNPNSAEACSYICRISNKLFDYYTTIKYAEELSKDRSKKYSDIYLQEAYAYSKTFEYDSAYKYYEIVSSIDKYNPDLHIYRGITYFEQMNIGEAMNEWEYAKNIAPERNNEIDYIIKNAKRLRYLK